MHRQPLTRFAGNGFIMTTYQNIEITYEPVTV